MALVFWSASFLEKYLITCRATSSSGGSSSRPRAVRLGGFGGPPIIVGCGFGRLFDAESFTRTMRSNVQNSATAEL